VAGEPAVKALLPLLCAGLLLQPKPPELEFQPKVGGAAAPLAAAPEPPLLGSAPFASAAAALRRRDCGEARAELGRVAASAGTPLPGFYAHACEDVAAAAAELRSSATPAGLFEDWRLYLLADSAEALGNREVASAALAELALKFPVSPLAPRAFLRAAQLAAAAGDVPQARKWVAAGRSGRLAPPVRTALDALDYELATRAGDRAGRESAARQLLVESPFEAARLEVAEIFRQPDGSLQWSQFLDRGQRERRVTSLLELGVPAGALATLDGFVAAERDSAWRLLRARALTLAERGEEALSLLAAETTVSPEVAWARASASASAATVRRGKTPLPLARRQALRATQLHNLWLVARNEVDRGLAVQALRALYVELGDEEPLDKAIEALTRLRQLEPADTTGATMLWERGFREYRGRNANSAIAYWSQLLELYPDSRSARPALYWSARAHEQLGEVDRAQALLRRVAASPTADFYRKQAEARLGGQAVASEDPSPSREPWPVDPRLLRARLLSDVGLDALALAELDAVQAAYPELAPQAPLALRALVLSRTGAHRESIRLVREVFPAIGGPRQATVPREALELYYPLAHEQAIRAEAARQNLDPALVLGIVHQESGFDPKAISRSGARGLMQVMPATGRELALRLSLPFSHAKLLEPEYSVRLGTTYFRQVLGMFDGNVELALAGYNSGPFRLQRMWRTAGEQRQVDYFLEGLTLAEPRVYFKRILVLSDSYRQLYPRSG
jgi:soluble lytic murein transglycosylase